ncbi:hypothetical protein [Lyngbya aestuarii]|uniref:hypothetical protein n=1 Tax=Lyngbya aestuarii TaxID=118322 RepID=UPI00403D76DF
MASQQDIQSLIADIDTILPKTGPRLPWSKPLDLGEYRRILERVRSFLASLKTPPLEIENLEPRTLSTEAQQIVQEVTQEINFLRAELREPLQAELADLRQQRDALLKEIQQLESTRQPIESSSRLPRVQEQIVSDFSQRLISHCAESLKQQLKELFLSWQANLASNDATRGAITPATHPGNSSSVMSPQERLEQLQQMQAHSDQLLRTLDTNQRLIFETLQGNLEAYQQSLSQGIAKMYSLGSHGEILIQALVDHLAQHLGQETSTPSSLPPFALDLPTNPIANRQTTIPDTFPENETFIPTEEPILTTEQLFAELENTVLGTKEQETTAPFDPTAEDSFPESPNSEGEILERLDFEDLNQDLNLELEQSQGRETPEENSQEIDDLYESLFGQESFRDAADLDASEFTHSRETAPVEADLDTSAPIEETANLAELTQEQVSNLDSVNFPSSPVAEVLLTGISASDDSVNPEQLPDYSVAELTKSELLTDSKPTSARNTDLSKIDQVDEPKTNGQSPSETAREPEGVEKITALTDLFEEMGLTGSTSAPVAESLATTTEQGIQYPISENGLQESLMEEQYEIVPPEVDLLPEDQLGSKPNREIQFAQNTLQQLTEDLDRFGEPQSQRFTAEELPRHHSQLSTPQPSETQAQQSYLQELLAEDYDEFSPLDWSDEEHSSQKATSTDSSSSGELTGATTEEENSDNFAAMSHESVESDFEPDLFPSEILKLDPSEGGDLTTPQEEIALDDESFTEMSLQEGSSSSKQELQPSEPSNGEQDLPQAESLNSEQPDQKTYNSDSEANS